MIIQLRFLSIILYCRVIAHCVFNSATKSLYMGILITPPFNLMKLKSKLIGQDYAMAIRMGPMLVTLHKFLRFSLMNHCLTLMLSLGFVIIISYTTRVYFTTILKACLANIYVHLKNKWINRMLTSFHQQFIVTILNMWCFTTCLLFKMV